jgi:hypothetical protein
MSKKCSNKGISATNLASNELSSRKICIYFVKLNEIRRKVLREAGGSRSGACNMIENKLRSSIVQKLNSLGASTADSTAALLIVRRKPSRKPFDDD